MSKIQVLFVTRPWWWLGSTIIRWALPVSRFRWALASHCMIVDGDHVIHATMTRGVNRQLRSEAMAGGRIVAERFYDVPDAAAGLAWAQAQVGKRYDWLGAFGVALQPGRDWQSDGRWFCHELAAAAIHAAGRPLFVSAGHVTDAGLLIVNPSV